MFEVEKNVPIPRQQRRKKFYPFEEMEIGDSFFVPVEGNDKKAYAIKRQSVLASVRYARHIKMFGEHRKFVTRSDLENGGIRCWRLK